MRKVTVSGLMILFLIAGLFIVTACDDDDGVTLDSDHEGWQAPGCWGSNCHAKGDTHHSDLNPYQCVECHGDNGAPDGHTDHTPCADCHDAPHGSDGFPDPESCQTCH